MTGLPGCSLQPNSGAQGEYAGLSVIRAYHRSRGDTHRNVCLIPQSAHGTNPASAFMAGMRVVVVKNQPNGYLDLADLQQKAEQHKDNLAAFMITYPSTYGVFESGVERACDIVHENGGQVYLDGEHRVPDSTTLQRTDVFRRLLGANFNAQVGLTSPGRVGADVCHLNLHKSHSIPHGGGGPGMGYVALGARLWTRIPN